MDTEGHDFPLHEVVQPLVSELIFQLSCSRPIMRLTSLPASDSTGEVKTAFLSLSYSEEY